MSVQRIGTPEEIAQIDCFYSDFYSGDGYFFDWQDFFDNCDEIIHLYDLTQEEFEEMRPTYVWPTAKEFLHIDAYNLAESACEDLYEDAFCKITDSDITKLQKLLDEWCDSTGVGPTYFQSAKFLVPISWAEYDKRWNKNV